MLDITHIPELADKCEKCAYAVGIPAIGIVWIIRAFFAEVIANWIVSIATLAKLRKIQAEVKAGEVPNV